MLGILPWNLPFLTLKSSHTLSLTRDQAAFRYLTLVTPMAPTFSPNVLVPLPEPHRPASMVPSPSVPSPRLMACSGGGGAAETDVLTSTKPLQGAIALDFRALFCTSWHGLSRVPSWIFLLPRNKEMRTCQMQYIQGLGTSISFVALHSLSFSFSVSLYVL